MPCEAILTFIGFCHTIKLNVKSIIILKKKKKKKSIIILKKLTEWQQGFFFSYIIGIFSPPPKTASCPL